MTFKTGSWGAQAKERSRKRIDYFDKYNEGTTRLLRKLVFEKYGDKCIKCGFNDWRALQLDHVNSNGPSDRKLYNAKTRYMKALKTNDEYQILCANCNWIKRYENKETRYRK